MKKKKGVGLLLILEAIIIFAVFLMMVLFMGNDGARTVLYFVDFPSLVCILLFVIPVLLVSGMAKDFGRAFLIGKRDYTLAQMKKSLESIKMVEKLIACSMGISTITALIIMLGYLSELSAIGPNIAVALITILYGLAIEALLVPLSTYVQTKITEAMDIENEEE